MGLCTSPRGRKLPLPERMQTRAFVLEAAFVLGVVTATDPQTQVSETVYRATLVGGYGRRILGTPLRQCWGGYYPQGSCSLPEGLGPDSEGPTGVRPKPEAGCPQAPPTSCVVRGSAGGILSGKAARTLQLGWHMSQ